MATVVAVAPVVAPAPEAAEAAEAVEAVEAPLDLDTLVVRMAERVDLLRRELALMSGDMKVLRRLAKRTERAGTRRRRAPAAADADRKPSGFARPSELSDELCDFLRVERGSALARTVATADAAGTGCEASQAVTAATSSADKRDTTSPMQSGAAARRDLFFHAPSCATR